MFVVLLYIKTIVALLGSSAATHLEAEKPNHTIFQ